MTASTVERLGDRALLVPRPPGVPARELVRAIRAWPQVLDVVVTRDELGIYFADEPAIDTALIDRVARLPVVDAAPAPGRTHALTVRYDGEDLGFVATARGLTVAAVIALHAGATYTVDTMGFAPGFAYLDGLDARLELPRRARPRERVAAGSVAIVGAQTAVYPFDSPGGWHVIGSVVGVRMFGEDGPLLALGDQVRFVPAEPRA
jgi:KipI family sensor histidine kinase inhibitor